MAKQRNTFNLLWDLIHDTEEESSQNIGTIVGRYASIIDDRIDNSGHSRVTVSLKLYTTEQLQAEIDSRSAQPTESEEVNNG
jgi:ribosome-binding protein aMBF1 (putative translation factor)